MSNKITRNKYFSVVDCPKRYDYLTNFYVDRCTNGCGSKGNSEIVPNYFGQIKFEIACLIHDLEYIDGNSKKVADQRLEENIKRVANAWYKEKKKEKNIKWWQFWKCSQLTVEKSQRDIVIALSRVYYLAVKNFGKESWDKGHKKDECNQSI